MKTQSTNRTKSGWILLPLAGSVLFIILYVVATFLYPGGSQGDPHSKGFSWLNNYWCNLLNGQAINGEYNTARPFALIAMFILSLSLAIFWFHFPRVLHFKKNNKWLMQGSGILSMTIALFLFTAYHDVVINIATGIAMIALTGTYIGLYRSGLYGLFWFGIFNGLLIAINNFLYYTPGMLTWLPVFQKITFLSFITWICFITVNLYKRKKKESIPA